MIPNVPVRSYAGVLHSDFRRIGHTCDTHIQAGDGLARPCADFEHRSCKTPSSMFRMSEPYWSCVVGGKINEGEGRREPLTGLLETRVFGTMKTQPEVGELCQVEEENSCSREKISEAAGVVRLTWGRCVQATRLPNLEQGRGKRICLAASPETRRPGSCMERP